MDAGSQPIYTQAMPSESQSDAATQSQQLVIPVASTSTPADSPAAAPAPAPAPAPAAPVPFVQESTPGLANTTFQLAAAHIDPASSSSSLFETAGGSGPAVPAVPAAETGPIASSSAPLAPGQALFHPFPEQDPAGVPLTGFASIPARAAVLPNARPYTRPAAYEPPAFTSGKGLSRDPPQRRFVNDQELKASLTNGNSDLGRLPGVVHEDEVKTLSVDELKRMGLGRLPSGASPTSKRNDDPSSLTLLFAHIRTFFRVLLLGPHDSACPSSSHGRLERPASRTTRPDRRHLQQTTECGFLPSCAKSMPVCSTLGLHSRLSIPGISNTIKQTVA